MSAAKFSSYDDRNRPSRCCTLKKRTVRKRDCEHEQSVLFRTSPPTSGQNVTGINTRANGDNTIPAPCKRRPSIPPRTRGEELGLSSLAATLGSTTTTTNRLFSPRKYAPSGQSNPSSRGLSDLASYERRAAFNQSNLSNYLCT
jgi:hypothetical protein